MLRSGLGKATYTRVPLSRTNSIIWYATVQGQVCLAEKLLVSCRSSAGQREFAGQRPTFYLCATQPMMRAL